MRPARHQHSAEFTRRYRPEKTLGEGGMGFVVRATDLKLGRPVAIKFLRLALASDPVAAERFAREAKATGALEHPNVVRIFDFGFDGPSPYAVYEFVEGVDLRRWLDEHGCMPPVKALELCSSVLDALEAAHRSGIIHRDVKPANVLLAPDGTVKVADFGIARLPAAQGLTAGGAVLGTPGYLAPEQLQGQAADARSDVYSAAALLYELVAGEPPFSGSDVQVILAEQLAGPPPPLESRVGGAPGGLSSALARAMEPEPGKRPQSAAAFAAELRAVLARAGEASPGKGGSGPTLPVRVAPGARRLPGRLPTAARRTAPAAGPARRVGWRSGLVAASLAVLALAFWRGHPSPPRLASRSAMPAYGEKGPKPAEGPLKAEAGGGRTVVARDLCWQVSETAARVHFTTARRVRAKLEAVPTRGGRRVVGEPGPATCAHDLSVRRLRAGTEYRLELGSAESSVRLVSTVGGPVLRTLPAGRLERDFKAALGIPGQGRLGDEFFAVVKDNLRELEQSGDPGAGGKLLEALPKLSVALRRHCLEGIAMLLTPAHEQLFLDTYLRETAGMSWDERMRGGRALEWIGGPRTIRAVFKKLDSTPSRDLPVESSWAAYITAGAAARSTEVADLLTRELSFGSEAHQNVAANVFVRVPQAGKAAELVAAYFRPGNLASPEYLLAGASWEPALLTGLLERALAAGPPGELLLRVVPISGSPTLVGPLLTALSDSTRPRRLWLARGLGKLGGPRAVESLEGMLLSTDARLRAVALLGLADAQEPRSLGKVLPFLSGTAAAQNVRDRGLPNEDSGPDCDRAAAWLAAGWLAGLPGAAAEARAGAGRIFRAELEKHGPRSALAAFGLGRAGEARDASLLESTARSSPSTLQLRALEGLYFLDRKRCGRVAAELRASGRRLPEAGNATLDEVCAASGVEATLYVPWRADFAVVGGPLVAGEPLLLAATGLPQEVGSDRSWPFFVREGLACISFNLVNRIALDDGRLVLQAAHSLEAPDGNGTGFYVIYRK